MDKKKQQTVMTFSLCNGHYPHYSIYPEGGGRFTFVRFCQEGRLIPAYDSIYIFEIFETNNGLNKAPCKKSINYLKTLTNQECIDRPRHI